MNRNLFIMKGEKVQNNNESEDKMRHPRKNNNNTDKKLIANSAFVSYSIPPTTQTKAETY